MRSVQCMRRCAGCEQLLSYQQHSVLLFLPLQSQEGSPPLIMLFMMAAAQPTPLSTLSAPKAQLPAQAPHSMHWSLSRTTAFLFFRAKTPCGQTSMHIPQPVHCSGRNSRLTAFERYFIKLSIEQAYGRAEESGRPLHPKYTEEWQSSILF